MESPEDIISQKAGNAENIANLVKVDRNSQEAESAVQLQHALNNTKKGELVGISKKLIEGVVNVNPIMANNSQNEKGLVDTLLFYLRHSILMIIFFWMSVYRNVEFVYHRMFLRLLTLAYYPNKTPQLIREDVIKLSKIPKRISCILDLKDEKEENGGIDGLINNTSEIIAWTISAGIPVLSIYEFHGALNDYLPELCRYINKNLKHYFGTDSLPVFALKVPHTGTVLYSNSLGVKSQSHPDHVDLEISLLSRVDGKPTIVELTKTMCELASNSELSLDQITIDLIDEELVELVGPEPDLLISFGPVLDLEDFPPWHIRLTELYWEPDNRDVNYAVFIRALQKYSLCKVNLGK